MKENHKPIQQYRFAKNIINSLLKEGYFIWHVIVNINEFPPYTKHVTVKMDEDTFIKVYAATDQITVFTRMIKDEIDILRLMGFEDKPEPF